MRNAGFLNGLLLLFAALAPACGQDGFVCQTACELDTGPVELPLRADMRYEAYAVGDGFFDEIEYLDNSVPEQKWVVVGHEELAVPWQHTATYQPGMRLWVRGSGRLQNGSLRVWFYRVADPDATTVEARCTWECSMLW